MGHVEKALEKAKYYEKLGDFKNAEKFLKIAEKYDAFIKNQEEKNNEKTN